MIFRRLKNLYWHYIAYPKDYAQYLGVKIGKNCLITTRNWSSEPYLISIGDNVQVTNDVRFHTHGGGNAVRDILPDFDLFGKIVVKDRAYIGAGAQIMPGVTIGRSSIVAAGSIVTRSVPDRTIVGGNPARHICTLDEYIAKNLKYNLDSKGMAPNQKSKFLLGLPDDKFMVK